MAKKLLALLVAAVMVLGLVPAAALAKAAPAVEPVQELKLEPVQKAVNAVNREAKKAKPARDALVSWDFEEDPTANGWNFIDADNDGKNWIWTTEAYNSGSSSIKSASYEGGALTPDNWAQSPRFDMPEGGATLTFQVKNYSSSYPEVFEVWYAFDGMDGMQPLATNQTVSGSAWVEVSYQIPDSDGAQCMIAIRHYGCTDQWKFYIDDVQISEPADQSIITAVDVSGIPARIYDGDYGPDLAASITVPEDANYEIEQMMLVTETDNDIIANNGYAAEGTEYYFQFIVVPLEGCTFAEDAALTANGGALELIPETGVVNSTRVFMNVAPITCGGDAPLYGWYFENEDELEGWSIIDNDGDGSCWYLLGAESLGEPLAYEGEGYLGSPSWNTSALTPDNFVIGPEVEIPEGTTILSFYAAGTGANWCQEHFAVYMVPVDSQSIDEFTEIMPETVATADYVNYTVDLSEYAGETIRFAFRHFNCTDLNWLRLDQVEIFNESGDDEDVITTIEINGFIPPVYGDNSLVTVTVPAGAHYSIAASDSYWDWYVPGGGIGMMTDTDVFDNPEAQYHLYLTIIPDEGWTVAEDFTVTINGGTDYVDMFGYNGGSMPCIYVNTITFQVEEPVELIPIDEINVEGFVIPTAGMTGAEYMALTVPAGANYHIELINAFNQTTGNPLVNEDVLEAGSTYIVGARVSPNEGYYFAEDATLLANGGTELMHSEHSHIVDSENAWIVMIEYTIPTDEPVEGLIAGYYFETQEEVDEWTFIGDDTNWVWSFDNPGGYDYTEFAHEGEGFIMSYSFVDYVGSYQANNWAISPAVTLPNGTASVSFYASNANSSYPETFSVYVGTTPNTADMTLLQTITPTTGYDDEWSFYEIDLTDYAGQTIYLAFYDECYDMYEIWIDQVEFWGEGGETPPEPTILGDVDLDGTVEVEDAILALRYAMGLIELTDEQLAQADVDGDGDYDLVDAALILRFAMDLIDHFPAEVIPD